MARKDGTVIISRNKKTLLLTKDNQYFIVKSDINEPQGKVITFEENNSLPMPSYLFAIAAMEEENLNETLAFIQNKWFKK